MQDLVNLFRRYKKYNNLSDADIRLYLMPSMKLKQCKTHYEGYEVIGFTNWAFLSDEAQKKFKQEGWLENNQWLSGNNIWIIHTICTKNLKDIAKWTLRYFTEIYGTGKPLNWLRIDDNKNVRSVVKVHTKSGWL